MEKSLAGKLALITGGGRGLGKAYALELAKAGADVVITDKSAESVARFGEASSVNDVTHEIAAFGSRVGFYAADLTDATAVEAMIHQVLHDFGRIDILVNNAGGDIGANSPRPDPNTGLDIKVEDIESVIQRNLLSVFYMCKYVGAHMRQRGGGGKMINIGSIAGQMPVSQGLIYGAAKAAVAHYTRSLADEMKPFDVNVNCLAPGFVRSARIAATRHVLEAQGKSRLERYAEPEELAKMVLFLAGPDSDRLTGAVISSW